MSEPLELHCPICNGGKYVAELEAWKARSLDRHWKASEHLAKTVKRMGTANMDLIVENDEWKSRAMTAMELVEAQMLEIDAWQALYEAMEAYDPLNAQRDKVRVMKARLKEAQELCAQLVKDVDAPELEKE